ncbi:MAG TPA: hypothetical protein VGI56_13910 [Galbitalea sp.]|jgi:hypothetical protein
MAHDSTDPTRGFPQYAGTGAPADAADLSEIATWAGTNIDRVVATQAALTTGFTPIYAGMRIAVTAIPGATFRYSGSAWVMEGIATFASASARDAAITSPAAGMTIFRTDNLQVQTYTGGKWNYTTALVPIIPTSLSGTLTGASIGPSGAVTLTAATGPFVINNSFTPEFDNYLVKADGSPALGNSLTLQLAASGTVDATATNYDQFDSIAATGSTAGNWPLLTGSRVVWSYDINLFNPARAMPTRALINTVGFNAAGANPIGKLLANGHRASVAYDGLGVSFTTSTTTGTIRIYGYNNN